MDLQYIDRLATVQEDIIKKADNDIKQLEKYSDEYKALKEQLLTLPDRVTYNIMVPFGTVALMPGKLVHTNEIRVLLGDDWFVDRSAKQAVEIIDRRLQIVDRDVASLKKQKDLFKPHLDFTKEFREQRQNEAQIVEEYNEDEEKAWRAQHRLNVKKYYEEQQAARNAEKLKEEEALYWKKMEEAEAEEHENEELDTQSSSAMAIDSTQSEKSETGLDHSGEMVASKTDTKNLSKNTQAKPTSDSFPSPAKHGSADAVTNKNTRKTVRWRDIVQNESMEAEDEEEDSSDDSEEYVELCRPTTINFVHTPPTNIVQPVQRSSSTEGSMPESGVQILSPADIGSSPVLAAPKSILKKRSSTEEMLQQPSSAVTHKSVQKSSSHSRTIHDSVPTSVRHPVPLLKEKPMLKVVERDTSSSDPQKTSDSTVSCAAELSTSDSNKRVSKFKAARLQKKPTAK